MSEKEVLHAFYSEEMEKSMGDYLIYETVDGQKVKCTLVNKTKEIYGIKWPDLKYMGEVVKCLKQYTFLDQFTDDNIDDEKREQVAAFFQQALGGKPVKEKILDHKPTWGARPNKWSVN